MKAPIGDGVTVEGPEELIREAMGVPASMSMPAFVAELADSARFGAAAMRHIDALMGDDVAPHGVDPEADTKVDPFPVGRHLFSDEPAQRPGCRAWHLLTGEGPWVLVRKEPLLIAAALPLFPDTERAFRGVEVDAWVVEHAPHRFRVVPAACLVLSPVEKAADDEETADETLLSEIVRSNVRADRVIEEVRGCSDRIAQLRYAGFLVLCALLALLFAIGPSSWLLTHHIR